MAHELGHGVHAALARPQGIFHFTTPLTLAETASIFGENIVLERLLERAPGPAERLDLLAGALDGAVAAVFRQIAMNRFEDAIHTERRERGELSVERFGELWLATQGDLLGDSVELDDDYGIWWSYIWHFVDAPGYVYAYAYGHLLALSVYRRYEEEGEGFVASYLDLLRAGGSRPPEELGAIVGVDLSDPGFWSSGLELIERQLDAAEAAAREAGRLDVIAERIALPGAEVELMRPPDAEALISEEAFEHEEFLPYWAELWASAVALAHDVSLRSLRGKRRRSSSAAGSACRASRPRCAGGRVLATDWSPDAVARHGGERRAERRASSRRSSARGPSRTRSWSGRRGRSCWRATCSTRRATSSCCSTCCRGSSTRPASCCSPTPAACRRSGSSAPRRSAAGRCRASRARARRACSSTASGERAG